MSYVKHKTGYQSCAWRRRGRLRTYLSDGHSMSAVSWMMPCVQQTAHQHAARQPATSRDQAAFNMDAAPRIKASAPSRPSLVSTGARPTSTHSHLDQVRGGLLFLHPLPLSLQLLRDALPAVRRDLLGLAAPNLVRRGSGRRKVDDLTLIYGARILCKPAYPSAVASRWWLLCRLLGLQRRDPNSSPSPDSRHQTSISDPMSRVRG